MEGPRRPPEGGRNRGRARGRRGGRGGWGDVDEVGCRRDGTATAMGVFDIGNQVCGRVSVWDSALLSCEGRSTHAAAASAYARGALETRRTGKARPVRGQTLVLPNLRLTLALRLVVRALAVPSAHCASGGQRSRSPTRCDSCLALPLPHKTTTLTTSDLPTATHRQRSASLQPASAPNSQRVWQ